MAVLTVRRKDGADLTADTVRPDGERLEVLRRGETVFVPLSDVRSIIAGEPANPDEPATDEGVLLADGGTVNVGEIRAASVMDADGSAVLVIKGTDGSASVTVPEDMIVPFEDTVDELGRVYGGDQEGTLIGDGGQTCESGYSCGPLMGLDFSERCGEEHPDGLFCTRPESHSGPHVACGGEEHHFLRRWEQGDAVAVTDGGWDPQPATLREGEVRDDTHASRNQAMIRDGRKRLAELAHLAGSGPHLCEICDEGFNDLDELADHDCRPLAGVELSPREILERTEGSA